MIRCPITFMAPVFSINIPKQDPTATNNPICCSNDPKPLCMELIVSKKGLPTRIPNTIDEIDFEIDFNNDTYAYFVSQGWLSLDSGFYVFLNALNEIQIGIKSYGVIQLIKSDVMSPNPFTGNIKVIGGSGNIKIFANDVLVKDEPIVVNQDITGLSGYQLFFSAFNGLITKLIVMQINSTL
mgnify:CR=1 FL=1